MLDWNEYSIISSFIYSILVFWLFFIVTNLSYFSFTVLSGPVLGRSYQKSFKRMDFWEYIVRILRISDNGGRLQGQTWIFERKIRHETDKVKTDRETL